MKIDKTLESLASQVNSMKKFGDAVVFERVSDLFMEKGEKLSLLIIGEAPGYEEVRIGKPFVGRSGKLLDKWLQVLQVKDYVITNVVKSHPVDAKTQYNRKPTEEEIAYWRPILEKEIKALKPKAILCLGDVAYKTLTNSGRTITSTIKEGIRFEYNGIPVIIYFHPSYLLRNKDYDWKPDMVKIKEVLDSLKSQSKL
ncbi:uracil-DNA glycosylase [Candidatus Mancarchaeum acidiphilum]|uniref:Uracil-DNA glycosylase n=1 Tax=Candidatus Mancarchaeum acidiphilum TaxID=1920749 RepID=A0A218NMG5_9ARCH|nr:uracil-DNA glycosylase [Candidatus Mancarchaeum acidiphilum]ASI13653.1 uracil-DNA glycosylase [Candidatus Mancarchaeum acidiphilum]